VVLEKETYQDLRKESQGKPEREPEKLKGIKETSVTDGYFPALRLSRKVKILSVLIFEAFAATNNAQFIMRRATTSTDTLGLQQVGRHKIGRATGPKPARSMPLGLSTGFMPGSLSLVELWSF